MNAKPQKKRSYRRLAFRLGLILLALAGIFWWVLDRVLPFMVVRPHRVTRIELAAALPRGQTPQAYGFRPEALEVRTLEGLRLKGWYLPAQVDTPCHTTLIMVHGVGGCKEHFLPGAQRIAKEGINVVLLDLRAQGQSEGLYCTYGFREKRDISTLVDTILVRHPEQTIGILGNSLGGAIALQTLSVEPRLRFGIIESTFDELEKVVMEYGADIFQIKSKWLADQTLQRASAIAQFPAFEIKPWVAAKTIRQPVFMAHGEQDDKIPIDFGRHNFISLASENKIWYPVPNGEHYGLWATGGEAYFQAMIGFVRKYGL